MFPSLGGLLEANIHTTQGFTALQRFDEALRAPCFPTPKVPSRKRSDWGCLEEFLPMIPIKSEVIWNLSIATSTWTRSTGILFGDSFTAITLINVPRQLPKQFKSLQVASWVQMLLYRSFLGWSKYQSGPSAPPAFIRRGPQRCVS